MSKQERPTGDRYRIAALSKGMLALREVARAGLISLADLSERTAIPSATLFRILSTLELEGYVERGRGGSYKIGVEVLTLGFASLRSSGLVGAAEDAVKQLSESTGETTNLGVLRGDQILYLVRDRNTDLVTAHLEVGSTLPAVSTSIGKALLAALPQDELARTLTPNSFNASSGPNAITTFDALVKELRKIREAGYAIQDQEVAEGLRSVAVPVYGRDGKVEAAMNIAVSTSRTSVDELKDTLLPRLKEAASRVSTLLGSVPPSDRAVGGDGRQGA